MTFRYNTTILIAIVSFTVMACTNAENKIEQKPIEFKRSKVELELNSMLNKWHKAAATANADAFFSFMTEDCIYLGTDPSEKWKRDELREWAAFAFDRDTAWAFTPFEREIYFAKDSKTAWFDEKLKTQMGECRGSGVLIETENGWKLNHYNLAVTILNEKMKEFLQIDQKTNPKKP
ncbi:MAG: nuclear transport factor 2 family protein [Bacteroidia bacterium]